MRILVAGSYHADSFAKNIAETLERMGHVVLAVEDASTSWHFRDWKKGWSILERAFPSVERRLQRGIVRAIQAFHPNLVFHDFPAQSVGKAIPYGTRDEAVVNVSITHDTAEFAVASIRRWWQLMGRKAYPQARRTLICADAGGSNGSRLRAWKVHLQALADRLGIAITVCHYPPGTSKWNKVEHRLFSFISTNWRGQPLLSYETVVNLIGATTTKIGLWVKALLDTREYEPGQKITDDEMHKLRVQPHKFHGDWSYTIQPYRTG